MGKREIDKAIEAAGPTNIHPIGKVEQGTDGPRMTMVIGGVDQWADTVIQARTALFEKYMATGLYTRQEALLAAQVEKIPGMK